MAAIFFIWFGLALLFTIALCRAASDSLSKPGFPEESPAGGKDANQPRSTPLNL